MSELPKKWDNISLGSLWDALNHPQRHPTPASTIEAIMYCVRERGIDALKEPDNVERLSRCDQAARADIERRCAKVPRS